MSTSKLAYYRRKGGLSQEQLSSVSGVSTRTIQRIESGKVEAHLATIKMLADALGIEAQHLVEDQALLPIQQKVRGDKMIVLFHLLALLGLCFPILNIILPGLLWFFKKDEQLIYDIEGRLVVNFQLTMSIAFVPAIFLMIFLFPVGFPLVLLIYFYTLVMSLVNIFRTINKQKALYPLTFKFLR